MWPFISQPAPSSFILFYSQHGDLTGGREAVEKGHGPDCICYSQFVLLSFVQTVFMALDDLAPVLVRQTFLFIYFFFHLAVSRWFLAPAAGFVPWQMHIILVNMLLLADLLTPFNV